MATFKKNKETKAKEPDASITLDCGAVIDIYEHEKDNISCKITLLNAFVIFGKIIKYDNGVFISYPSYYSKKKKQYISQAFCFDTKVNEEISEALNSLYK